MSREESETRKKILAAAWDLLSGNQSENVRMGDIAKAANLSRQAVYLHFKSRVDLMVAAVQYGDELCGAAKQVQPWREATGADKLDAWITFWGNYLPQIFGVAKVLLIARETDEAAAAAWDDRMADVRNSCCKTIEELASNNLLADQWSVDTATDLLWTMLSVANWELLTKSRGWSTEQYVIEMQALARQAFLKNQE